MKKSNVVTGVVYVLLGIGCLLAAIRLDFGVLYGLAGGGIGVGVMMIYRYFYWTSTKRAGRYQEKLEEAHIEMHDELKEKIRDKSGRYAYVLGLVITSVSCLVFSILDELRIVENADVFIAYLFVYWLIQAVSLIVIYRYQLRKYE